MICTFFPTDGKSSSHYYQRKWTNQSVSQVLSSQRSADSKETPTGPFGGMKGIAGNSKFYKDVGEGERGCTY